MVVFANRSRGPDRFLEWKIRLFSAAAVLALVGMYLDERWITGSALALLVGGLFLRFLPGGGGRSGRAEDAEWGPGVEPPQSDETPRS